MEHFVDLCFFVIFDRVSLSTLFQSIKNVEILRKLFKS